MNKEKAVCFTGHRGIGDESYIKLMSVLLETIQQKIDDGYTIFCTGGALGFDTMAAVAVLRLKEKYRNIKLHLYLPCRDQHSKWPASDKAVYQQIADQSDRIFYTSEVYTPYCMAQRNRALVDNSSFCIAYCTQPKGGTAYTISYAMDNGVDVVNLAHNI